MMDWNGNMSAGGWIFSMLAMIAIVTLTVVAIVWITREFSRRTTAGSATSVTAREILDRRLASGEIRTEQYDQLRTALAARPGPVAEPPPV